jgi:hypothetical protein
MSLWIHLNVLSSSGLRERSDFQQAIDATNNVLVSNGISPYEYPYDLKMPDVGLPEIDGSRSDLSQLRYVAAMLLHNEDWLPPLNFKRYSSEMIPRDLNEEIANKNRSHLICNSHGKYIPVDFGDSFLPPYFLRSIGSSLALKNEIESLAKKLNVTLGRNKHDVEQLIESMIDRNWETDDDSGSDLLLTSKIMMMRIYEVVLASIEYNLIILMD